MDYDFGKQYLTGKAGEWVMDKYHAVAYKIQDATRLQEKQGIDRVFVHRSGGRRFLIEIKTDFKAQIFGNIIIETVSVDTQNKPGWAVTSQSDIIIFYLWYLREVLYFRTSIIKKNVPVWKEKYGETAVISNQTYNTIGIKLPLEEARKYAFATRSGVDPDWMKENHKRWLGDVL
jgi:hypothetical protein